MISVSHLCKTYPGADTPSVDDLTFHIGKAEVCGLLGRNGAGKSTTLNLLTGCLAPTSGSICIAGTDLLEDPTDAKRRIGYAPENPPLYPDMTLSEYLLFVARAKSVRAPKEETARIMEKTNLARYASVRLAALSKGSRQRAGLAQALIGDPDILILDEPSIGLDPEQITRLRAWIAELGKTHTILLSSHILSEITLLCGRILLLSEGRLVADDTPGGLLARSGKASLEDAFLSLTADSADTSDDLPQTRGRRRKK